MQSKIEFVVSPLLTGIKHSWFKRYGGVSSGEFSSLNIKKSLGDPDVNVEDNLKRAAEFIKLKPAKMIFIRHNFKDNILIVDKNTNLGYHEDYDAVITNIEDIWLAQGTADCGTVIISDLKSSFAALVHCSWHTTKLKILQKVINKIKINYGIESKELIISFGPMACGKCFEFGSEAKNYFSDRYLNSANGKLFYDLKKDNINQLLEMGVEIDNIWDANICTMKSPDFFSYRRSKKQGKYSGRFLTAVGLQ